MHARDVTRRAVARHRVRVLDDAGVARAEEAYRAHARDLTVFATGLVGPAHAPDVVSAAILGCLTSASWPAVVDARPYLYRAVLNQARQAHRSESRRLLREQRASLHTGSNFIETDVNFEVAAAVGRLSLRQRAVVFLTYWEDLTPAAVALRLGVSEGSVRRHLARARERLRKVLDG